MKKILRQLAGQLFLIASILVISLFLFVGLMNWHIDGLVVAEKTIFLDLLNSTKYIFNHAYWFHTILFYLLMVYGIWSLFKNYLLPSVLSIGKKHKDNTLKVFVFLFLIILLTSALVIKEMQMQRLGFYAGSRFGGNNFSLEHPAISWELTADERGMVYYDADSAVRIAKRLGLVVNRQGFANPFNFDRNTIDSLCQTTANRKKKKLFFGDSFLQGIGASKQENTFIELYRQHNPNEIVCSFGIGGNDPVQYRLAAEKFIPELMPDEVNVMFCGWNDIIFLDRKPLPHLPSLTYIDGVGFIHNYIFSGLSPFDTLALQPDTAYRLYRQKYSLQTRSDMLSVVCRQTIITSQLYFQFHPQHLYPRQFADDSLATYRNLKRIKTLADSVGANFTIAFIPTPPMKNHTIMDYEQHFKWAFGDLWQNVSFCSQSTIIESDCSSTVDWHFNDKGQIKFADFLQKTLKH